MRADSASGPALWVALALLCAALQVAPSAPRPVAAPPRSGAARLLWGLPLDLNHEDVRILQALPGIGPSSGPCHRGREAVLSALGPRAGARHRPGDPPPARRAGRNFRPEGSMQGLNYGRKPG